MPPLSRTPRRWAADLSPPLPSTAAATAARSIARHAIRHHEPFFAPIAAVIALSTALGECGSNMLRLPLGVLMRISAGELTLLALGGDSRGDGRQARAEKVCWQEYPEMLRTSLVPDAPAA